MTVLSMVPNDTPYLPPKVTEIAKETLRNFPHSKKVGNYLLGNTLGEGSFAKVKEALHIPTGERVAVKIIDKKKSREDSYVRKNLRREGKILQMIRHNNIVQLLEIMETQNSYYLVTELCRGGDLMDYISQRRRLSEQEVKKFIRQIVSAADYLHRLGILHRDLKIENLLLDEYHDIKIIDFGLSNCIKVVQTKDGPKAQEYCVTQCGSPAYAAPELLGRRKYGPQVDTWSIGINMYAMLTGNLPFTVEPFNIKTLHSKMINSQMNPMPEGVTRECRDLIKRFLTPDPDRRIRLDDVMKHPWIANGTSNPMSRAPCPNKLKTEALENSILKHMSENQGFRLGEIIRFVTGNVPSSATAMYHLFYRKLRKYIGNLKASGKISSDNRLLNRSQQVPPLQFNNKRLQAKTEAQNQNPTQTTPVPTEQPQNAHTTTTSTPTRDMTGSPTKLGNDRENVDNHDDPDSGINTRPWRRKEHGPPVHNNDAEPFTDIMAVRNANEPTIPRVKSPVRTHKDGQTTSPLTRNVPSSAKKYIQYSQRRTTLHSAIERGKDTTKQSKQSENTSTSLGNEEEKENQLETTTSEDEQFRKRAFSFPGKIQRPKVAVNKFIQQRAENESNADKVNLKSNNENNVSTVHNKTNDDNNVGGNVMKIQYQRHQPQSPVRARRNSAYRDELLSRSPQPGQKSPTPFYIKRPFQRRVQIPSVSLSMQRPSDRVELPSSPEPEGRASPVRQHLTRPVRTNRIIRARVEVKEELTVDEQVSEISSGSTHPSSSRHTNGSVNSNSGQTGLPSISSPNSPVIKRKS